MSYPDGSQQSPPSSASQLQNQRQLDAEFSARGQQQQQQQQQQPPTQQFASMGLNANAAAFVPNANAPAFVPSWLQKPAATPAATPASAPAPAKQSPAEEPKTVERPPQPAPAAAAEAKEQKKETEEKKEQKKEEKDGEKQTLKKSESSSAISESQAAAASAVIAEVKAELDPELFGEFYKEHLNVVFIGHGPAKSVPGQQRFDAETAFGRYDEVYNKLSPFLKATGFNPKTGKSLSGPDSFSEHEHFAILTNWAGGPSLLELLDTITAIDRKNNSPLMMPISDKYKEMGTIVVGKIESGILKKNQAEIMSGFVLCSPAHPTHAVTAFEAQVVILDTKNIIAAGYQAVLHVHNAVEEVTFGELLHRIDKKTNRRSKRPPPFCKRGDKIIARFESQQAICVERFADYPQLGRFTLRDEAKTIAIGKITKLITE
ncbi:MAG: hypothetical protein BJ554DRAFT_1696 [Olpidium bornovanus]|uniref:GTP-eEF1A C-terminal domain-containing protein n=1 Tax=Olpidium bornovanus TaxID=278681 RepID=A0A8H7ZRN2_9FUNG|nr:MAG: hypothetical protein BJ554DRAFT_1696 [Olpidium bornovanus]